MITAKELRDKWIGFFSSKGFVDVSDRSVIPPASDKSLLFINSGVAAIKSYFCGDSSLPGKRLFSAQRVIRTGDIDEIGRSIRHHTYFEMLGNFSIGNISRREAIDLAWEFLVTVLGMDAHKLYATVFEGDEESYEVWKNHLPEERIVKCGRDLNFWDMGVGPCGPCTEIYFDKGEIYDPKFLGVELLSKGLDNDRFLEIWNLVFSDYLNVDGKIIDSPTKNLDTGAGLERLLTLLQNKENSFDTTLFTPIKDYLKKYVSDGDVQKIWASSDYFRTSCILIRDGVEFGNKGREYVLRKVFRRACACLGESFLNRQFFVDLVSVVSSALDYYDWSDVKQRIVDEMWKEYELVFRNRKISQDLMHNLFAKYSSEIPAEEVFNLVTRDGIAFDYLEHEILSEGRSFSRQEYDKLFEEHRSKSFNENISSAFVKQVPSLMSEAKSTIIDYDNVEIEAFVSCLYVGAEFKKCENFGDLQANMYVVLSKTSVFPLTAGQEADIGWIYLPNDGGEYEWVKIHNTFRAVNGQILHQLLGLCSNARQKLYSSGPIRIRHDEDRRKKLERNHTAEHLLYAILKKLVHSEVLRVSGSKREDVFTLEIQVPEGVNRDNFDLESINLELNAAINKRIKVGISWGNMDRARKMGIVGRFDEVYEMNRDNLRFVDLGEYGTELCIGTHVRNTGEIEEALIVKFAKEQKNIYKFSAITGKEEVQRVLGECGSSKEYLWNLQHKDEVDRAKKAEARSIFLSRKKELMEELLSLEGRIKILEKEIDVDLGMAVFRGIRSFFQEGVVMLFFREERGHRFFVASNGVDLVDLFQTLREKGGKCGGNSGFGSGIYEGDDFMEIFCSIIN